MFVKFMSNYLKHHNLSLQFSADTFITRLKLEIELEDHHVISFLVKINDWMKSVDDGNLKELNLCILPSVSNQVLDSFSTTYLSQFLI